MKKNFRSLILPGALVCLGVLNVSTAKATLVGDVALAPGGNVFPGSVTGDAPGTLLADQVQPFSILTAVGTMSGTIESAVYMESGGTLGFY